MHALKHTPSSPHHVIPPHLNTATAAAAADVALIFSCNKCGPPLYHPAVKAFPETGSSTWVRGPGNWLPFPHNPSRSPSGRPQALVSPGQASHLQGPDWESITEAGWEHEVGGAGSINGRLQACGSLDAWPDCIYTPLTHT